MQENPGRAPRDALSWEPFAEGPEGPRQPEFTGQKIREEKTAQRENARDLQRDPLQNSGSQLGYACEKTIQGQGKNDLRGLEGAMPGTHTELGIWRADYKWIWECAEVPFTPCCPGELNPTTH